MKKKVSRNVIIQSFDLDNGVYEYVIRLSYGNQKGIYTIYGFSEYECTNKKNKFIKEWFNVQKEFYESFTE